MNEQTSTQPTTINNTEPSPSPVAPELLVMEAPSGVALLAKEEDQLSLVAAPVSDSQAAALIDAKPVPLNSQLPQAPRKHRRNGRIACLPRIQRDMVNRMLWNNVPYKNIVSALSEDDFVVTEKNLSNWAIGGYVDWRLQQEQVLQNRLDQDHLADFLRRNDAQELPEVGLQAAATRLSQVMLQKLNQGANIEADLPCYSKMVDLLCRLNRELTSGQKQRDDSQRTLGRAHDPIRIKEVEEMSAMDHERHYSNPPADSGLTKPPEPPVLPPLPTSEFLAQRDREEREENRAQNMQRTLQTLKAFSSKPKTAPEGSSPSDANRVN